MDDRGVGTVDRVVSAVYVGLVLADVVIVVDIASGGSLHRWWARQTRALYRWVVEPLEHEIEVRRAATWVVWEAMQVLEDARD